MLWDKENIITAQDRIKYLYEANEPTHQTIRYPFPDERKTKKIKKDIREKSIQPIIAQYNIEEIEYVRQEYVEPYVNDIIFRIADESTPKSSISIEVTTGDTEIKIFPKTYDLQELTNNLPQIVQIAREIKMKLNIPSGKTNQLLIAKRNETWELAKWFETLPW